MERAVEVRGDGPRGDPEGSGGLVSALVEQDPESHDLALSARQTPDGPNEDCVHRMQVIGGCGRRGRLGALVAKATPHRRGVVQCDSRHPADRVGMRRDVVPVGICARECLLDRVLGAMRVADGEQTAR